MRSENWSYADPSRCTDRTALSMSSTSSLSANDASRGPIGCTSKPLLRSSSLSCFHAVRHSSIGHATCTRWLPRRSV